MEIDGNRKGGGLVDAPGRWVRGPNGEYALRASYLRRVDRNSAFRRRCLAAELGVVEKLRLRWWGPEGLYCPPSIMHHCMLLHLCAFRPIASNFSFG